MPDRSVIRETVLRSLSAIGATREANFYAEMFAAQDAERFALIVLDARCLKNPLLESLISNLRILADLGLVPVLVVGALDSDRTLIKFQAQRLAKELESVSLLTAKLDTASYGLIPEVRQKARQGRIPILEMTERRGQMNLQALLTHLKPYKVIFLQPSGGISKGGERVPVINIDKIPTIIEQDQLSAGQTRFLSLVENLSKESAGDATENAAVYVIASPLNLLAELFTVKGSGTMLRQAADISLHKSLTKIDTPRLQSAIENTFSKPLDAGFMKRSIHRLFLDKTYRGGAIFVQASLNQELVPDISVPYLSKFWVIREAQGEGIARDIWDRLCQEFPTFFWRSRRENAFNGWYMRVCDGMQSQGDWRVFWVGLKPDCVAPAIEAALAMPDDFTAA